LAAILDQNVELIYMKPRAEQFIVLTPSYLSYSNRSPKGGLQMNLHKTFSILLPMALSIGVMQAAVSNTSATYDMAVRLPTAIPVEVGIYPMSCDIGGDPLTYTYKFANRPLYLGVMGKDYLTINTNGSVSVTNTLYAKEIRVQSRPFPDYVFADGYNLLPLQEVEAAIKRDRHLPGVPTAEAIAKEGLPVSAIVVKQMEKIEELTLYAIALKKENAALEARILRIESSLALGH
jgi:hypothetical protein